MKELMTKREVLLLCLMAIILLLMAAPLLAQVPEDNILDGIVAKFRDAVIPWRTVLTAYTERLFWLLVTIEFTWTGIELLLRRADISEVLSEVMRRIMIIGFYLMLIQHSATWNQAIVDSFRKAASDASASITGKGIGTNPSDIFDAGIEIALRMTESMAFSSPGLSIATAIASLVIVAIYAIITGQVMIALIEMYIALGASIILLGFGGSRWTRDFATNQLKYVVSVGLKLFGLQLIIAIGGMFITSWFESYEQSWSQVVILLGASIILAMLVSSIPALMQGLITGASVGGVGNQVIQSAKGMAAQAAGVGMAAGALGAGVTAAGIEAFRATSSEQGVMARLAGTASGLGRAAFQDSLAKMSGSPMAHHGNMGGRMASDLRARRLTMECEPKETSPASQEGSSFSPVESQRSAPSPLPRDGPRVGLDPEEPTGVSDGVPFGQNKGHSVPSVKGTMNSQNLAKVSIGTPTPEVPSIEVKERVKGWNPAKINFEKQPEKMRE